MGHIDEHTLELFFLEASEVAEQHDAIASHLRRCPSCSALSAEIAEFYELTAIHYSDRPAPDEAGKISGLPDDPYGTTLPSGLPQEGSGHSLRHFRSGQPAFRLSCARPSSSAGPAPTFARNFLSPGGRSALRFPQRTRSTSLRTIPLPASCPHESAPPPPG